ncbi:MAG TPA: hypothetical protein PKY44_03625 [Bacteroidales bacterium]|jgi:chaperonin GroES|nr:hypothetical protein [Bacteroidales bacterium]
MKLLHDLVLLEPEKNDSTESGILLLYEPYKNVGTILEIGTNTNLDDENIKIGDKIIYENYSGSKITIDNKEYILVHCKDIIAKINF